MVGALRASWQLWAVALAVTVGAVVSLTTEITGPMDEFLFTTLAVAAVAAALTRTASRAGNA